jgi:glutamine synthetase
MKDLHERLQSQGVHTLVAQFTDLHGVAKGKFVPLARLNQLLIDGVGFSGPSIWGTGLPRIGARSEYFARGVAPTVQAMHWMPGYARVVCDGYVADAPFDACPRQVLKRAVARLAERGWQLRTGIEPEFFLLRRTDGRWAPADAEDALNKPSYDLKALPRQREFLRDLHLSLSGCGLDVLQVDHEDSHGQYEVNVAFDDALASADHLMLFKLAAHGLAERHGMVFSMMPKPFANQPGSGMHFHVSLWQGQRSLFDANGAQPSSLLRHFIGGVLAHSAALCAIAAPTVNSYKRLVVGKSLSGTSWAPAVVAHGPNNRTALVRTLPGRFEWRLPDSSANPYLATAALIVAGLDGIDRRLDPGPERTEDLFECTPAELRARGIATLPQCLDEAIDAFEADATLGDALGATLQREFISIKRAECNDYSGQVTDWELDRYV